MTTLQKIGKYEILAKIGEGGFGVVYKGKDPFIKRLVAVKTCSSENESIQKRFFREAEIAGNLHHANVVTIHDFGVEGDTPYLVQEFLTGEDLDVLITDPNHHISLPTKVRYLRSIGEGLRYAHAQGVIHRDIKPANIRILENDRVKVMDFGIAKLKDQESQLTQTGMALGTVAYMSPEQLKGESVDHRVDIFSFGVLAYELVVGRRPFQAESVSTLFYQLLHENPPPITDPEVPKQLVDVIEKCLAKSLDVRYGSFDDVLKDLDAVQNLVGDDKEAVTADPFSSDPTSTLTRLAAKAARSIDAGDLTAAEVTLDLAKKQCDAGTFNREFGELVAAIQEKRATRTTGHPGIPGIDVDSQISRIDEKLRAGKLDTAAVAFTALEMQFPGDPKVAELRTRVSQAINLPPPSGSTPAPARPAQVATPPPHPQPRTTTPASGVAQRQSARTGPLVAAIAAVVLVVTLGAVFLVKMLTGDDRGGGGDSAAGDGQVERQVDGQGDGRLEGVDGADSADLEADGQGLSEPNDAGNPDGESERSESDSSAGAGGAERTATTAGDDSRSDPGSAASRTSGDGSPANPASNRADAAQREEGRAADSAVAARTEPSNGGRESGRNEARGTEAQTRDTSTSQRRETTSLARDREPETPSRPERRTITPTTVPADDPEPQREDRGGREGQSQNDQARANEPADTPLSDDREPESSGPAAFDMDRFQTQNDIRATLDAYRDAWISRDEDLINRYYPGANVTRRDVRSYRRVDAEIRCDSFEISDRTATANCAITIVKTPKSGNPETTRYTKAELVKQGVSWVISTLR
ncbi:MAG TPA: protein kinase [Thermoanaerobaculia bacterium]|nr:protein kinase [Thermoanaerobaculia bacterium]